MGSCHEKWGILPMGERVLSSRGVWWLLHLRSGPRGRTRSHDFAVCAFHLNHLFSRTPGLTPAVATFGGKVSLDRIHKSSFTSHLQLRSYCGSAECLEPRSYKAHSPTYLLYGLVCVCVWLNFRKQPWVLFLKHLPSCFLEMGSRHGPCPG